MFKNDAFASVCVLTDLEPDDILALRVLAACIPPTTRLLVVVGEGRCDKVGLASRLIRSLGFSRCTIAAGCASDNDYPTSMTELVDESSLPFGVPDPTVKELDAALADFDFASALVIAIKPFPELLRIASADTFSTTTLAVYGSFNLRSMLKTHTREAVETFVNSAFRRVILYESFFAAGAVNSGSKKTMPELFSWLGTSGEPFVHVLKGAMDEWNSHIAVDCAETIARLGPQLVYGVRQRHWPQVASTVNLIVERNAKCLGSIAENSSYQLVIADFALVALLFWPGDIDQVTDVSSWSIGFDEYSRTALFKGGPVEVFKNVNLPILDKGLRAILAPESP